MLHMQYKRQDAAETPEAQRLWRSTKARGTVLCVCICCICNKNGRKYTFVYAYVYVAQTLQSIKDAAEAYRLWRSA